MLDLSPELHYTFARSSGKGGQNVNKVETKVILKFDVSHSELLNPGQKALILEKLRSYANQAGILQLSCEETRSQSKNREIVTNRFYRLLEGALRPPKRRKKTRVPRSAQEKRLKDKLKRSEKKQNRRKDWE